MRKLDILGVWTLIPDQDRRDGECITRQMTAEEREIYGPPTGIKRSKANYLITQADVIRQRMRRGLTVNGI